jgi:hypothetical protein
MTRFIDTTSHYAADIGKWTRFAWGGVADRRDSTGAQLTLSGLRLEACAR